MVKNTVEVAHLVDPLTDVGRDVRSFRSLKWWGVGLSSMAGLMAAEQTGVKRLALLGGVAVGGMLAGVGQMLEDGAERNRRAMVELRSRSL